MVVHSRKEHYPIAYKFGKCQMNLHHLLEIYKLNPTTLNRRTGLKNCNLLKGNIAYMHLLHPYPIDQRFWLFRLFRPPAHYWQFAPEHTHPAWQNGQQPVWLFSNCKVKIGMEIATSTAIMATTINSSARVNPFFLLNISSFATFLRFHFLLYMIPCN